MSGESLLQAALVGIMGGAAASGIYGTVKSTAGG
jgi:hypothetical protein